MKSAYFVLIASFMIASTNEEKSRSKAKRSLCGDFDATDYSNFRNELYPALRIDLDIDSLLFAAPGFKHSIPVSIQVSIYIVSV